MSKTEQVFKQVVKNCKQQKLKKDFKEVVTIVNNSKQFSNKIVKMVNKSRKCSKESLNMSETLEKNTQYITTMSNKQASFQKKNNHTKNKN